MLFPMFENAFILELWAICHFTREKSVFMGVSIGLGMNYALLEVLGNQHFALRH